MINPIDNPIAENIVQSSLKSFQRIEKSSLEYNTGLNFLKSLIHREYAVDMSLEELDFILSIHEKLIREHYTTGRDFDSKLFLDWILAICQQLKQHGLQIHTGLGKYTLYFVTNEQYNVSIDFLNLLDKNNS